MNKTLIPALLSILLLSCVDDSKIAVNQTDMVWRYDTPATKFWEGLPIGTGRFGAMIPGATEHEVIAFNDETLWTGGPYNSTKQDGPEILKKVREYAFAKKWKEADIEAKKLFGDPIHVQFYQPMGRLNLDFGHKADGVSDYSRELDMDDATVNVSYSYDGVKYSRRVFASYPDQVIVYRLEADRKSQISFSAWLTSLQPSARTNASGDMIAMEGTTISEKPNELILPPQMRWQAKLKVIPEGGEMKTAGDKIIVSDANAVTLILAGATNWVSWNNVSANASQRCGDYMEKASAQSYKTLLDRHLTDYRPLFASCKLDLGHDAHPERTTTASMEAIRAGENDLAYEARYFQYGRYLMLAAARENTLAFNNHNMWLNDLDGRWRGRWTLNINIQECYWPVENTNLSKLNESLLLFTENLAASGARTAKEHFGCHGWCACHGTDVWFISTPTDAETYYGLWFWGGHWIMQQLYDHYLYTLDTEYLKRIFPLLKGATEFCLDFLVKEPESGYYVTCPSTSPENSFLDENGRSTGASFGAAGEIQIVRRTLKNFIEAYEVLSRAEDFATANGNGTDRGAENRTSGSSEDYAAAKEMLANLPPHKIGQYGQLQEWFYDFSEAEPHHRHTSHLFALYPDDDISLHRTPELIDAVKTVLKRRGDNNMGWSGAWKISQHARLEEPEKAYEIFHKMQTDVSIHPAPEDSQITPSFEGNQAIQGVTAGVAEMLMQSFYEDSTHVTISLLPALPTAWQNGAISGLRARGGYDVDIQWQNGALEKAVITAHHDGICRLRTKTPVKVFIDNKELTTESPEQNLIEIQIPKGQTIRIKN
ncbi:MAG: glycoside hydrolase family 95 protein [Tannerella sp.]|nr:glycoside hydrolase family 95 protein [Tannerella sp.]